MKKNDSAFLLYLPVLHQGYLDWFAQYPSISIVYVIDESIISKIGHLRKDVRALSPNSAVEILRATGRFNEVKTISSSNISSLNNLKLHVPQDDVTSYLQENYLAGVDLEKYPVFLRWNRDNTRTEQTVDDDAQIDFSDIPTEVTTVLASEAAKSTDWWRRIGAVLVDENDKILLTSYNKHLPTQYTPYIDGDMRMNLGRGDGIELIGVEHAEASLIAAAASQGINTTNLELYVSAFPCPPCAKFIAHAGIKTVYYQEGYAMGNGLEALRLFGTKVVRITNGPSSESTDADRAYPEKPTSKS